MGLHDRFMIWAWVERNEENESKRWHIWNSESNEDSEDIEVEKEEDRKRKGERFVILGIDLKPDLDLSFCCFRVEDVEVKLDLYLFFPLIDYGIIFKIARNCSLNFETNNNNFLTVQNHLLNF